MDEVELRTCTRCKASKPLAAFGLQNRRQRSQPYSQCKDCRNDYKRTWYTNNREAVQDYQRSYEDRTRRRSWLKTKYGITPEQYDDLLARQEGRCAICRQPQDEHAKYMDVDHCHDTGKVRGLLCRKCNTGIGSMGDDPERLLAAVAYLRAGGAAWPLVTLSSKPLTTGRDV